MTAVNGDRNDTHVFMTTVKSVSNGRHFSMTAVNLYLTDKIEQGRSKTRQRKLDKE